MKTDKVEGAAQKVGAGVKEGLGKITGNPITQSKGKFEQAKGQARENVGDANEILKSNK